MAPVAQTGENILTKGGELLTLVRDVSHGIKRFNFRLIVKAYEAFKVCSLFNAKGDNLIKCHFQEATAIKCVEEKLF